MSGERVVSDFEQAATTWPAWLHGEQVRAPLRPAGTGWRLISAFPVTIYGSDIPHVVGYWEREVDGSVKNSSPPRTLPAKVLVPLAPVDDKPVTDGRYR